MAKELADFGTLAQAVWVEPTITGKQEKILVMIDECRSKEEKKQHFLYTILLKINSGQVFVVLMTLMETET